MFGVEPQHALGPPLNLIHQIETRIVVVVAPVAEEDHNRAPIDAVKVIVREFGQRRAQVGVVIAGRDALQRKLRSKLAALIAKTWTAGV